MEEKNELAKKGDNETVSDELKCSTSDKLQEERMLPNDIAEGGKTSSETDYLSSESKLAESLNESKLSESSKYETTSKLNKYSESNTSNPDETIDLGHGTTEFKRLLEKHKTALKELGSNESKTSHKISIETPKKTKLSKSRKHKPVSSKTNLQTLISNEETREIGLFDNLFSKQEFGSFQSGSSKTPSLELAVSNDKPKSPKSEKKFKSSELDKSKSSRVNKKAKHSDLNRKSKSSEMNKKSKSSELERKSESLKEKESLEESPMISKLLKSLQVIKLSETSVIDATKPSEGATASIQTGKQDLFSESEHQIEHYFSLFQENKTAPSPTGSSDSGTLTPGSDDLESKTCSPKKLTKSFMKSKLYKVSAKSNFPEPSARSNLSKSPRKLKLTKISTGSYMSEETVRSKLPRPSGGSMLHRPTGGSNLPISPVRSKSSHECAQSDLYDQSVRTKLLDQSVRSKFSDQSVKSKMSDQSMRSKVPDQSGTLKQSDQLMKSKQPDPYAFSNLSDSSLKSNLPDPPEGERFNDSSAKSKLLVPSSLTSLSDSFLSMIRSQWNPQLADPYEETNEGAVALVQCTYTSSQQRTIDLRLNEFVKSRRSYFLNLQKRAKRVKTFMDQGSVLKKDYKREAKAANTQRRKRDADDWLKLLFYWDLVTQEMDMIIEMTDMLYDSDENMLMTSEEFHDYMRNILCVFRDVAELTFTCQNGLSKYTRFCSSHDMFKFLSHTTLFESRLSSLVKKIKIESQLFTMFKKIF